MGHPRCALWQKLQIHGTDTGMFSPSLSIQALEIFDVLARTGSLRATAAEIGLSIASVSHHLNRLEKDLDVILVDRSKRPMVLTLQGVNFLNRIREGLRHIRQATEETAMGALSDLRSLRIGIIEDFDSEVSPRLAASLSRGMPKLALTLRTEPSHQAMDLVARRHLDLAIAFRPEALGAPFTDWPLLRDPFVMAVPKESAAPLASYFEGRSGLPLLRFNSSHLIGERIDAQLRRNRIAVDSRHEIDSNQTIMALVAQGYGWTITTPVGYFRAHRFRDAVTLHPLPIPGFTRYLSLIGHSDGSETTARFVFETMRRVLNEDTVQPALQRFPWLRGKLMVAQS